MIDRAHEAVGDFDAAISNRSSSVRFSDRSAVFRQIRSHGSAWTREVGMWNIRHAFRGGMLSRYIALYDVPIVDRFRRLIGM